MKLVTQRMKKIWEYGWGRTALAAACAHSLSISIGICQGYSAILIPQLNESLDFNINHDQGSWLASLGAITNPLGSVLSGLLAEWFGRKKAIQISTLPFFVGWLCIAFAYNITWLYAGRLITGIAAGMSSACYTYVSEISTPKQRGILQALGPVAASFGILLTYTLGYFIRWEMVALVSITFALFSFASIHFFPESPGYLLKVQFKKEAFDSLLWFRRSNAAAMDEFQKYAKNTPEDKVSGFTKYLRPETAKPFLILVTFFFLQELSGIYSVLFYAVNFFQEAEVKVNEYISSIIVGVIRFVMSIIAAFLINKYARRKLCMFSSGGMTLSLAIIVVYIKYYEFYPSEVKMFSLLPLFGILLNVLFSMVGMLPIPWILVGELFPLQVRSVMSGIVICIAQCFIFICVKIYPNMINYLSFSGTLVVFTLAAFVALLFSKYCLPETKNKSLEDIEEYFRSNHWKNSEDKKIKEPEGLVYTIKVER